MLMRYALDLPLTNNSLRSQPDATRSTAYSPPDDAADWQRRLSPKATVADPKFWLMRAAGHNGARSSAVKRGFRGPSWTPSALTTPSIRAGTPRQLAPCHARALIIHGLSTSLDGGQGCCAFSVTPCAA